MEFIHSHTKNHPWVNLLFALTTRANYHLAPMKNSIGVYIFSLFITSFSWAAIELPNVIGSNMVLQRDLPVPIWGWGEPGKNIRKFCRAEQKYHH